MQYGIPLELHPLAFVGHVAIIGTPGRWVVAARASDQVAVLSPYNGPRRPRVFKSLDSAFATAHRLAFEGKGDQTIRVLLGATG